VEAFCLFRSSIVYPAKYSSQKRPFPSRFFELLFPVCCLCFYSFKLSISFPSRLFFLEMQSIGKIPNPALVNFLITTLGEFFFSPFSFWSSVAGIATLSSFFFFFLLFPPRWRRSKFSVDRMSQGTMFLVFLPVPLLLAPYIFRPHSLSVVLEQYASWYIIHPFLNLSLLCSVRSTLLSFPLSDTKTHLPFWFSTLLPPQRPAHHHPSHPCYNDLFPACSQHLPSPKAPPLLSPIRCMKDSRR